jgi:RNA-directed DNA polymerase
VRSLKGKWRANYSPKLKQRTALLRKLKDIFRGFDSQPIGRALQLINPILGGWVNYFAIGNPVDASVCQMLGGEEGAATSAAGRNCKGFGWKRWSRGWLYDELGLFNNYHFCRQSSLSKAPPAR